MVVDSPVAGGESNEASLAVAANLPLTWVSCFNGPCLHTQAVISDGPLHDSQKKRWAVARLAQAYPAPCAANSSACCVFTRFPVATVPLVVPCGGGPRGLASRLSCAPSRLHRLHLSHVILSKDFILR